MIFVRLIGPRTARRNNMARLSIAKGPECHGDKYFYRALNLNIGDIDMRIGFFRWPWVYRDDYYHTLLGEIVDNGLAGLVEWLFIMWRRQTQTHVRYHLRILCFSFGLRKRLST